MNWVSLLENVKN